MTRVTAAAFATRELRLVASVALLVFLAPDPSAAQGALFDYRAQTVLAADADQAHPRETVVPLTLPEATVQLRSICMTYNRFNRFQGLGKIAVKVEVLRPDPASGELERVARVSFRKRRIRGESENFRCRQSPELLQGGDVLRFVFKVFGAPDLEFPADNRVTFGAIASVVVR